MRRRINLVGGSRPFVFARLQEISTVVRAIERDFALLAATLRADAAVDSGAKTFLFADFTNGAAQRELLANHYGIRNGIAAMSEGFSPFQIEF